MLNLDQTLGLYRKQNKQCTRFFTQKEIKSLNKVGITTFRELLNSNLIELRQKGISKIKLYSIVTKILHYFEDILIGPEGYLIAAIYCVEPNLFPPYLVPLKSENTRKTAVEKVLMTALSPKSRKILEYRFGLYDGNPRTMEEIGKIIGRTRNRLEIIINQSLKILNHPSITSKYLMQFKPHHT